MKFPGRNKNTPPGGGGLLEQAEGSMYTPYLDNYAIDKNIVSGKVIRMGY